MLSAKGKKILMCRFLFVAKFKLDKLQDWKIKKILFLTPGCRNPKSAIPIKHYIKGDLIIKLQGIWDSY